MFTLVKYDSIRICEGLLNSTKGYLDGNVYFNRKINRRVSAETTVSWEWKSAEFGL